MSTRGPPQTRYGLSETSEYKAWWGMLKRCIDPGNSNYRRYGARGIAVCERWHSFECFISDMGLRPSPQHSIDRINNDGNYEPDNCRWATAAEQSRNRRSAKLTTEQVIAIRAAGDVSQTALARQYGVDPSAISLIIRRRIWRDI